ncbi:MULTISPECIES: hypothetical protein [unclassified Mesorhizobium]|uniref:hypothetical protein n=1 Tax=unclassified Mesorhizobium TaxID=325217 RepID=UPI0015E4570A|nr:MULTISPECIES: hypothetical protein [unclassified Mesorhizobium]MBZ9704891.1 hypothetical protein [Mesorhizobium sp. CO1-1-3]MBZ9949652.1 hypothetical protein [Mesorhizobium sp. BR1-1-11]
MNERLRELAVDGFPGKTADEVTDFVYSHDTLSVFATRTLTALSARWQQIASVASQLAFRTKILRLYHLL